VIFISNYKNKKIIKKEKLKMITKELKNLVKGVAVVTITPRTPDLKVDEAGVRKNIKYLIENGIVKGSGMVIPVGSTGECFSLTIEERKRVAAIVLEETYGKVPVFVGCNETNIDKVIDLAKHAESIKADGIMVTSPYYWCPPSKAQIVAWFKKIAQHTNLPIMVYNNAVLNAIDLSVDIITALVEIDNIVALKESTGSIVKYEEVCRKFGDKINIISGSPAVEPYATLMGAAGFVSGFANMLPQFDLEVYRLISEGKYLEAKQYHDPVTPFYELTRRLNSVGGGGQIIAALQEGTKMVGLAGGNIKLPLLPLSEADKQELKRILISLGAKVIH
jgi:4-hydroxy-tetrahydrodipicolinate synthase